MVVDPDGIDRLVRMNCVHVWRFLYQTEIEKDPEDTIGRSGVVKNILIGDVFHCERCLCYNVLSVRRDITFYLEELEKQRRLREGG